MSNKLSTFVCEVNLYLLKPAGLALFICDCIFDFNADGSFSALAIFLAVCCFFDSIVLRPPLPARAGGFGVHASVAVKYVINIYKVMPQTDELTLENQPCERQVVDPSGLAGSIFTSEADPFIALTYNTLQIE